MTSSETSTGRIHADFLLIGGGIAAATAAQTLRDEGATGSITMLCAESDYPYNRPDLTSHVLAGDLAPDQALVRPPQDYLDDRIDVRLDTIGRSLHPARHLVIDQRGRQYHYGKLLIATGAEPRRLDVPGAGLQGIFCLHTLRDVARIREFVLGRRRIVILGSSFVAMEAATSFSRLGLAVTLVDQAETVFPRIHSRRLSAFFLDRCAKHGIDVRLRQSVTAFHGGDYVAEVVTTAGDALACDAIVLAIGVAPELGFLGGSGIALDDGILVDTFLRSNQPNIFAAGDIASYIDRDGSRQRSAHWDNARNQGRVAAQNMLGRRVPYDDVLHYFCDFLDFSFTFLGKSEDADLVIGRGDLDAADFAEFYIRDNRVIGVFSTGRPAEETRMVETLIRQRTDVSKAKARLADRAADLAPLARATILILQGGGALGAFECGVIRAMEEDGIYPSVIGGISVGALNGVIAAANPRHAFQALDAFWNDLSLDNAPMAPSYLDTGLAVWRAMAFGVPAFFRPRWLSPPIRGEELPSQWTSLYDASPLKELLEKYVDFSRLGSSPVRLFVGAVDVELGKLKFFDTKVDRLTPEHIIASCSLPPIFRWTTIDGRHYWDGGIISNSPLEHVLLTSGIENKDVVIVDLFPGRRRLPRNLAEVVTRRDEIIYGERIRSEAEIRELVHDYQALVAEIMLSVEPGTAERLKEHPRYIHLMGRGAETSIIRIVREPHGAEPPATDYDFLAETIARHKQHGYETARKHLRARRGTETAAGTAAEAGESPAAGREKQQNRARR